MCYFPGGTFLIFLLALFCSFVCGVFSHNNSVSRFSFKSNPSVDILMFLFVIFTKASSSKHILILPWFWGRYLDGLGTFSILIMLFYIIIFVGFWAPYSLLSFFISYKFPCIYIASYLISILSFK